MTSQRKTRTPVRVRGSRTRSGSKRQQNRAETGEVPDPERKSGGPTLHPLDPWASGLTLMGPDARGMTSGAGRRLSSVRVGGQDGAEPVSGPGAKIGTSGLDWTNTPAPVTSQYRNRRLGSPSVVDRTPNLVVRIS